MPTYDYVCLHCGHRFEVVHGVHAEGPLTCPNCGEGPIRKAISAPSIHFKGSGWAKKDRTTPSRPAAAGASAADAKGSETAPATPAADKGSSGDAGQSSSDGRSAGGSAGGSTSTSGGSASSTAAAD